MNTPLPPVSSLERSAAGPPGAPPWSPWSPWSSTGPGHAGADVVEVLLALEHAAAVDEPRRRWQSWRSWIGA